MFWLRRHLLAIIMLLPLALPAAETDLRATFEGRYQAWRQWCEAHRFSSSLTGNQEFSNLVALGPQAVPLFLEKAEAEAANGYGVSMTSAVSLVARVRLPHLREAKSNRECVNAYLQWWREDRKNVRGRFLVLANQWQQASSGSPEARAISGQMKDLGIDALPFIAEMFQAGEGAALLPLFITLTGGQGAPAQGTPEERIRAAAAWWAANREAWTLPPTEEFSLQVALVLDAPQTTLAFTLTNHRAWPRGATPLGTNYNRLRVIDALGNPHEIFTWKEWERPPVVVPALGRQTWRLALPAWFNAEHLTVPGCYRLAWDYEGARTAEVPLLLTGGAAPEEVARTLPVLPAVRLEMLPIVDAKNPAVFFLLVNGSDHAVNFTGETTGMRSMVAGPEEKTTDLPYDFLIDRATLTLEGAAVAPGQRRMRLLPFSRLRELLPAPGTQTLVWHLIEQPQLPPVESRLMVLWET
ncbi:MAG: hypothetical protein ACYDCO_03435 [Armatimonadota bacterium]